MNIDRKGCVKLRLRERDEGVLGDKYLDLFEEQSTIRILEIIYLITRTKFDRSNFALKLVSKIIISTSSRFIN